MSNLNNNTTQLEALLAKVNALPEAGGSLDTSDATATAEDIMLGETAYGAEGKITGTFTIQNELTEQNDLISQITTLVTTKANPQGGTEDLDTELTAQESLISQLSSILDSKASGGSGEKVLCHAAIYLPIGTYHCMIFEEGMTWNDFFESDYAYIYDSYDNRFISLRGTYVTDDQGIAVSNTTPIQNNGIYVVG